MALTDVNLTGSQTGSCSFFFNQLKLHIIIVIVIN